MSKHKYKADMYLLLHLRNEVASTLTKILKPTPYTINPKPSAPNPKPQTASAKLARRTGFGVENKGGWGQG